MDMKKQGSNNQCDLYSLAMILDEEPATLVAEIGHDGTANQWPEMPHPRNLRGFHIQELQDCCLNRGLCLYPVESLPVSAPSHTEGTLCHPYTCNKAATRFMLAIENRRAILIGRPPSGPGHAVAWDGHMIYDPNGMIYNLSAFQVQEAWILGNR